MPISGACCRRWTSTGSAENTIVIFTSDNGGERFSKTWPFTGMKQELLEGGLRIPAIARWPGQIAAGSVSDQAMITMDWVPTLLARRPERGPIRPIRRTARIWRRHWRARPRIRASSIGATRPDRSAPSATRDWKYLRIAGNEFLFDVTQDPRERANLKDRHKDVFDRLKGDWEAWNATMLEERPRPATYAQPGNLLADHYGVTNPQLADPPGNSTRR